MRLIDADEAKKLEHMFTLKPSERILFRMMLERMPTYEPPNNSLTLEELREMDGEPVYVTGLFTDCCGKRLGAWALVDIKQQMCKVHGGGLAIFENHEKSWLAYRRKPKEGV